MERRDVGRTLFDDRLSQGQLRVEVAYRGGDIRVRLAERRSEIAIADPRQQLAGLHRLDRLVVSHQRLRNVPRHFGRDDPGIGFDIQVAPGREAAAAKVCCCSER